MALSSVQRFPTSILRVFVGLSLILSGVLVMSPSGAVPISGGVLGGFEQDGDQEFQAPHLSGATLDWENSVPLPIPPLVDDTVDSGLTGDETQPLAIECTTGGATPAKSNLLRAYVNPRLVGSEVFLDLAWVRAASNGSANAMFEFNQADSVEPPATSTGSCAINRTDGDLLITYDFGGGNEGIRLWRWTFTNAPTNTIGQWTEMTAIVASAAVNTDTITDYVVGGTIPSEQFGEATINLTAAFTPTGGQVSCATFGQARVRTRSNGQNFNAMNDRLPAAEVNVSTCGSITVEKTDDQGNPVAGAVFEAYRDADSSGTLDNNFDAVADPGEDPLAGTCTTALDMGGDAVCTIGTLNVGDYFVREASAPTGYTAASATVGPIPVAANENVVIDGTTDVDGDNELDGFVNIRTQWQLTLVEDDRNLVGTAHTFTAHLSTSSDGGQTFVDAPAETLTFDLDGPGSVVAIDPAIIGDPDNDCSTDSDGECTIQITSPDTGTTTVTANFEESGVTVTTPVTLAPEATKDWVDYRLSVGDSGVNRVNTPHTFTVLLEIDEGTSFGPVGAGETIDLTWSGDAGQVTSINGDTDVDAPFSCTTDTDGECEVVVNSSVTGIESLDASYDAVVGDTSATYEADAATKRWIDWTIDIDPDSAENLVDNEHTFTVTVTFDDGENSPLPLPGVIPAVSLTGASVGSILTGGTCAAGTDSDGQCTVVITSAEPGLSTLNAVLNDTQFQVGVELAATPATKQWVDYQLTVAPSGVNRVGDPHTFTALLETDTGDGFDPVGAGEEIQLEWSGDPDQVTSISGDPDVDAPFSCTTNAGGECTVVVNSSVTGVESLDASYDAVVGPTSATIEAEAATKRWIDWQLSVSPLTDENLVDNEHVFTVTALFDDGETSGGLEGVNPTVSLQGPGTIVTDNCDLTGTDAAGECTTTVTSAEPGLTTLVAELTDTRLGVEATVSSNEADKQWVDYRITVTPEAATHDVDTTANYLVTLDVARSPFEPAPAGEEIDLVLTGVGEILQVNGVAVDGNIQTCVTNASGQCTVQVTSADPGDQTLTATYHAVVGDTEGDFSDSGEKTWIEEDPYDQYPGDDEFDFDTPFDNDPQDPAPPAEEEPAGEVAGTDENKGSAPPAQSDPVASDPVAVAPVTQPASEDTPLPLAELPRTGRGLDRVKSLGGMLLVLGGLAIAMGRPRRRTASV